MPHTGAAGSSAWTPYRMLGSVSEAEGTASERWLIRFVAAAAQAVAQIQRVHHIVVFHLVASVTSHGDA
jgi:hypothetical protein